MKLCDPTINLLFPKENYFGGIIPMVIGTVISVGVGIAGAAQSASAANAAAAAQAQEAENARAVAGYNANIARQNNEVQYQMALYQSNYNAHMASVNQAMALASAQMAEQQSAYSQRAYEQNLANAEQQEKNAAATRAQTREAADRERQKNEQQIALMRSKVGASGVTFEGTPLASLADAARIGETSVQDIAYAGELQSRKEYREASNMKFDAYGNLLEAKGHDVEAMNLRNQSAMYGYDASLGEYDSAIAGAHYRIGLNEAKLVELGGEEKAYSYESASQQSRYSGTASLISGIGGSIGSGVSGIGTAYHNYNVSRGYVAPHAANSSNAGMLNYTGYN